MTAATPEVITTIETELGQITAFPWFWWGDADTHAIALCGRQPGMGVSEVLSTIGVDRDPDSRDAKMVRDALMEYSDMSEEDADEYVREDWCTDGNDGTRSDNRLALTDENYIRHPVEDLAVFTVARAQGLPDDTPRSDRRIYRAQVCDVRNINGRFIQRAPERIRDLVATIRIQEQLIADLHAQLNERQAVAL